MPRDVMELEAENYETKGHCCETDVRCIDALRSSSRETYFS